MNYPLYDELLRLIAEKQDKNIDIPEMCMTINSLAFWPKDLAADHYEEIYTLLLHHECVQNQGVIFSKVPNDGKTLPGDSGVLYTPQKLPVKPRQLIDQYIEFYSKK